MTNQVQITKHPVSGDVITVSQNNPEYGTIRVESVATTFVDGFIRNAKRSALIRGKVEELQAIATQKVLPGKIVVMESLQPFFAGQEPKINPQTDEPCLLDDQPIYRQTEFTQDLTRFDVLVAHNNVMSNAKAGVVINYDGATDVED